MTKEICELSIDELKTVSGGGLDFIRPFLPSIITKPTGGTKPATTTTTPYPSASFDPVTVRF